MGGRRAGICGMEVEEVNVFIRVTINERLLPCPAKESDLRLFRMTPDPQDSVSLLPVASWQMNLSVRE